jgi:hypothetical protein
MNNASNNLNESRTYFGDEIKEVVDWLIESPYNNWQEEDREYLMNCDKEKLFKYESDTSDLESAERSLYESIQGTVGDFCELKGIDTDQFVEFLQTNFDWARHCEAWTIVDFDCLERCFSKLDEATVAQAKRFGHKALNEGKFADKVIPTLIGIGATAGIAAPLTGLAIHQNKSFDRLVDNLGLELSDKANQPDGASCFVNAIKDFKYDGKISKEYGMDIDGLCDYLYDYSNKHFSVTGDGLDISYEDCGDYYLISYEGEYIISIGNPNSRSKKSCHAEDSFKISKDYFGTQFILDEATIPQAKRFATRKHGERGQIRKATGAPYIVHPEGVAKIVKDFGGDDEQIQAAWLHDTMEDTGTWEEDLREKFGDRVADLVSELTNDDFAIRSIGKEDYMSNKLVNLSDDALLIKLSDFLYNIKDHCPMKTLERMKKNLEALNFSGRKLDDKCDKLLIDCLEAIDEEM